MTINIQIVGTNTEDAQDQMRRLLAGDYKNNGHKG